MLIRCGRSGRRTAWGVPAAGMSGSKVSGVLGALDRTENLNSVVPRVDNVDSSQMVNRYPRRSGELPVSGSGFPPFPQEFAAGAELLYPVVEAVGNIHVSGVIDRNSLG